MFKMQNREYVGRLIIRDREYLVDRERGASIGKCPLCGGEVKDYQEYCHHCGQHLDWREETNHRFFCEQITEDNSIGVCRKCLEIVPYGTETCPSCGRLLGWGWGNYEGEDDSYLDDDVTSYHDEPMGAMEPFRRKEDVR